jgi:hypothetical protein
MKTHNNPHYKGVLRLSSLPAEILKIIPFLQNDYISDIRKVLTEFESVLDGTLVCDKDETRRTIQSILTAIRKSENEPATANNDHSAIQGLAFDSVGSANEVRTRDSRKHIRDALARLRSE